MSKIVVLRAKLGASQILNDLLKKIAFKNSVVAEWIKELEVLPLIKEYTAKALVRMEKIKGIKRTSTIKDAYREDYRGQLDGALKTDGLPNGLGFKVNSNGEVEFIADSYGHGVQEEIKRLRGLFTDAFLAEMEGSIYEMLDYEVEIQTTETSDGKISYYVEGTKQGE